MLAAAARHCGRSNKLFLLGIARQSASAPVASRCSPGRHTVRAVSSTASVVSYPARVPVKAYYIGRSILFTELFASHTGRKVLRQDCAILYGPFLSDVSGNLETDDRTACSTGQPIRGLDLGFADYSAADDQLTSGPADWQLDSNPTRSTVRAATATQAANAAPSYELALGSQLEQHQHLQQPGDALEADTDKRHAMQPHVSAASVQRPPAQDQRPDVRRPGGGWAQGGEGQGLLVVTRFGAAVFLAVPEEDHWPIIRVLLPGVTLQPVPFSVIADSGRTWKNEPEELQVMVRPHMQRFVEKREDCLLLQCLDVGSIHVIATCIGQSIALQYHMWMLNTMMTQFHALRIKALQQLHGTELQGSAVSLLDVLRSVRLLGPAASTHDLARLVAGLNKLRIEMTVGLQLLEYHPMAWQKDRYDQLWAVLRREFELEEMHALLNKKLKAVAEEAAFDMDESFQSRYQRLVWVVVGLLLFGNMVDVWDLFGRVRGAVDGALNDA